MYRILSAFLVIAIVSTAVCSSENPFEGMENPPEIIITANGQPVEYSTGMNMWNGSAYDRMDPLPLIMGEDSDVKAAYIKLGGTIDIAFTEFVDNPPVSVEIQDKIITEEGLSKYAEKVTESAKLEVKNGKMSYDFKAHPASLLSSDTRDYEDGNTYRGFYLRCIWNPSWDCEYSFVIRTDAEITA